MAQVEREALTLSEFQVVAWNVFILRTNRHPFWSKGTLADRAGIALGTIDDIESYRDPSKEPPRQGPAFGNLVAVARALGVWVGELFDYSRAEEAATRRYRNGRMDRPSVLQLVPPLADVAVPL